MLIVVYSESEFLHTFNKHDSTYNFFKKKEQKLILVRKRKWRSIVNLDIE